VCYRVHVLTVDAGLKLCHDVPFRQVKERQRKAADDKKKTKPKGAKATAGKRLVAFRCSRRLF